MMGSFVDPETAALRFETVPAPEVVRSVVHVEIPAKVDRDHAANRSGQQDLFDLLVLWRITVVERNDDVSFISALSVNHLLTLLFVDHHRLFRNHVDAAIECIGCGVCYASCDVVTWNPEYLGPAALNRAWTLTKDERETKKIDRLRAVAGDAGCHACHTHMSCTERCPKKISPTAGIAGLKREIALAVLRKDL